jgi:hypothetical protein
MRHWIAVASLAATLALLIPNPVLAQTTMHGGGHVVGHHHRAVAGNRSGFSARTGFDDHFLVSDRTSGRFITAPRHRFAGFGRFSPFDPFNRFAGFDGVGGWGWGGDWGPGWVDYGSALASGEPPAREFGALPPPPPSSLQSYRVATRQRRWVLSSSVAGAALIEAFGASEPSDRGTHDCWCSDVAARARRVLSRSESPGLLTVEH